MTDNEFDRTARAWLEDGPNLMSDRALQFALDEIHATRQRRAFWPARGRSRTFTMIRLVAAAGAILLAVVGFGVLSSGGRPGPTPSPTASPMALTMDVVGPLRPGTYVTADPFLARVTFTVPAGWEGIMGGPYLVDLGKAAQPGAVSFQIFDTVYADPCDFSKGPLDPLPGPSVDDLATALAGLPRLDVSVPTDVTIDGYRGKQLTLTAPSDMTGCALSPDGNLLLWELPLGARVGMTSGEVDRVWILDVDGQRLVIDAPQEAGALDDASKVEVQAVLDSIRIAPAKRATASPS
jgi:hypothetical protein